MNNTPNEYITSLESVLVRHFAPDAIYHGAQGALRLGREVGYGLADYPDTEIRAIINTLYSRLIVRFTFTSLAGVPINANEFIAAIGTGIAQSRSYKELHHETPHR